MAAKQKTLLPPAPETREHVLRAIRTSSVPLAARDVRKLPAAPEPLPLATVVSILEEHVADGALRELPPKTSKGKPRYWDRDPLEISRAAALEAVQRAEQPLTTREVSRRISAPLKLSEPEWAQILDGFVADGMLHAIPPATAKGKGRYWHRDALEFARRQIVKTLDAKGSQTEAQLRKLAKGLSDTQFQQLRDAAISAGEMCRHPAIGKVKKELFGRKPPSAEPYLREVGNQLSKLVPELLGANFTQDELRRTLVQLIEAAGIRFAAAEATRGLAASTAPDGSPDLLALMRRIEPGADRGALVVSRDLRRAARIDKESFDRAVLALARQGKLSLHRHDFASSLTPTERDELVTDGQGTYYVGVAIRQSTD